MSPSVARHRVNNVPDGAPERIVFHEQFVNLGVFLEQDLHRLVQGLVVGHACGVRRVLLGVLIGRIGSDLGRNVFTDALGHAVAIGKQGAEVVVEGLQNLAQAVQLGLPLVAAAFHRYGFDLGIAVGQRNLQHGFFLNPVAVHVDGVKNARRQVFVDGRRQLGHQQVEQNRKLFPACVAARRDRGQKIVASAERLGLALEVHLLVFVQFRFINRLAYIQNWV